MTTSPVVSVTDELIADLERAKQDDAGRIYCNGNVWMGQGPASRCGEIWGSIIQCAKCKELESKRSLIEQVKSLLAEREELKRDAARYRMLRDGASWPAVFASSEALEPLRDDDLDAAMQS